MPPENNLLKKTDVPGSVC